MSESWKVQASFKFGRNKDGLLNVRADGVPELKAFLDSLASQDVLGDLTVTTELISALDNASGAAVPAAAPAIPAQGVASPLQQLRDNAAAGVAAPPPAAPPSEWGAPAAPVAPAPASTAPTCIHGARGFVTGNKDGRAWSAWMCPTPKGAPDKCAPQWA